MLFVMACQARGLQPMQIVVNLVFAVCVTSATPLPYYWNSYLNALPASQLPDVPLLGNGHLGIALDSHSSSSGAYAPAGPGVANSIDLWMNTNSMWSCTACNGVDPDNTVPACCSVVALGN